VGAIAERFGFVAAFMLLFGPETGSRQRGAVVEGQGEG